MKLCYKRVVGVQAWYAHNF